MFNSEIKGRYIVEKEKTTVVPDNFFNRIFSKSEPFEKSLNKDICNFTVSEIVDFYKIINTSSIHSLNVINSALSLYTQWCLSESLVLDGQNHFSEISQEQYESMINIALKTKKIFSRKDVLNWVEELFNPSDGFLILGLFEGICGIRHREFYELKYSDFANGRVKLNSGRTIPVSDKLISLAEESVKEDVYYSGTERSERIVEQGDIILRSVRPSGIGASPEKFDKRILMRINRITKFLGIEWCSGNDFIISGKIDFITRRSNELGISGRDYLYGIGEKEINKQYSKIINPYVFYKNYGMYLPQ